MGVYFKGSKYAFLVYMYASFSNGGQYLMDRICSYGIFTLHVFRKKNKKKTKKKKQKKLLMERKNGLHFNHTATCSSLISGTTLFVLTLL